MKENARGAIGRKLKKTAVMLALSVVLALSFMPGAAADYYMTDSELGNQAITKTYTTAEVIDSVPGSGHLSSPTDLFIDSRGHLYIADGANNRVVVMDKQGQLIRVVSGMYGAENRPFNEPNGVFVDENQRLYVADTKNGRIVLLDKDGRFLKEFKQPTEDAYDKDYPFMPTKVSADTMGNIFVTNQSDFHGIIVLDEQNRFHGYMGGSAIKYSFTDTLIRLFATQAQKEQIARRTPPYISNFSVSGGLIYATSFWEQSAQLKKLTPAGDNIYPVKFYGETNSKTNFNTLPGFSDIAVGASGIVYASDMVTGKIYVYDQEGNNLAVFGGEGTRKGLFNSIVSIAVDTEGTLYILDGMSGVIQVMRPTALMKNIELAVSLYYRGEYEQAREPWNRVLELDPTNHLANIGIAKTLYRSGDYTGAMKRYELSFDRKGFSQAFSDYRLRLFRTYFVWVVLVAAAAVAALLFLTVRVQRLAGNAAKTLTVTGPRLSVACYLKMAAMMVFHPLDCIEMIKVNRKKLSYLPTLVMLALFIVVEISGLYLTFFPFSDINAKNADLFNQIVSALIPLLSWLVVCFALCSISNGKQTLKESLFSSMLAFTPYLALSIPLQLFSHLLSLKEAGIYSALTMIVLAWSIFLLLLSVKVMNEYSVSKLVGIMCKTLFGIACLWMIAMIFYVVINQSLDFIKSVYREFSMIINAT